MIYLIIGGGLAFVLFGLQVPRMSARRRISKKAHADYARCRGTLHARQLHAGTQKHELALKPFAVERGRIGDALDAVAREEVKELRRALEADLVHGPLAEVRGIGPKLRDRIVEACFDGTLDSLKDAQRVPGVGAETAADIQAWVQQTKNRLPQLLKGDFGGKEEILSTFVQRRGELVARRTKLDQILQSRRSLLSQAGEKLASLQLVTPTTFRAALQGNPEAAERVAAHTLGAFPEWETTPVWFTEITAEPDRNLHEV